MTRVDEDRETQRAQEQQRQEAAQKERVRKEGQEFSRFVSQSQQKTAQRKGQHEQGQRRDASQRSAAGEALMARHGIQSRHLTAKLQTQGKDSGEQERVQQGGREVESRDNRRVSDEKSAEGDRRVDTRERQQQNDRLAAISRDDPRGHKGSGGGGDTGGDAGAEGQLAGQGHVMQPARALPTAEAKGAAGARLPQHVLDELVKRVLVGVNAQGISEFQIEFRENVLAGSRLFVSAEGGKISARFETPDASVKRLLKASEGELARAFGRKGLHLERFDVLGP